MVRLAIVGLGKMGLSHLAMIRMHPAVEIVGVCDMSGFLLDLLAKNADLPVYSDYEGMLSKSKPDAVLIATPSAAHEKLVRTALDHGVHVFCEKPFSLDWKVSEELAAIAESKKLVNQVGYHYRFVGAFEEMKRLIDAGTIGKVSHVFAEAYGPVVLKPKGGTWRAHSKEGGGCLYDYAAHPLNLLNWVFGMPERVSGTVLNSIFSQDVDDEVYSTLIFPGNVSAQLSVNWSDESYRKMSVNISVWGTEGRIVADRQECQTYLRAGATLPEGYETGWNIMNTTQLTTPVWFYVRGEEYSAQLDYFIKAIESGEQSNVNSFRKAAETDRVLTMMRQDSLAATGVVESEAAGVAAPAETPKTKKSFFRR